MKIDNCFFHFSVMFVGDANDLRSKYFSVD